MLRDSIKKPLLPRILGEGNGEGGAVMFVAGESDVSVMSSGDEPGAVCSYPCAILLSGDVSLKKTLLDFLGDHSLIVDIDIVSVFILS